MEQFIKVYFWLAIIGSILRLICIGYVPYPRNVDRGADCIQLAIALPFLIWSAILLWA